MNKGKQQEEPQQKSFTELSELAKPILNKNFDERTQEDIELLIQLASSVRYFKNKFVETKELETLQQLCKAMKIENIQQGRHLFKIGDEGSKFYLVLNGKISLRVPNKQRPKELVQILVMQAGQSFGETALYQNVERQSNMLAVVDSIVLTIDRFDWEHVKEKEAVKKQKMKEQEQQQQAQPAETKAKK